MPAGCDYTCKNEDCECFNTGFVITDPWPMGHIDEIIESQRVKEMPEFRSKLKELKSSGREYACITFPNVDKIETKCYRVHLWSVDGKCVWNYDVVVDKGENLKEAIKRAKLPKKCPQTNSKMLGFREIIKEDISCPYCNENLKSQRWFAKED